MNNYNSEHFWRDFKDGDWYRLLFVMLWLTIPLWFIPLSVVICWLLGVGPK
ncbi:hypothetical protein FACS18942_08130 [Planctomycetales bacterium]|nr:hypothetical protein FACS18942_08130 [Planctomycetales bacterium]GHT38265.1 hypothetical protein FACS189427_12220 [Planctomycetales bacterium]